MINEIFPHQFNNTYKTEATISDSDYVLHYNDNSILLKKENNELRLIRKRDIPELDKDIEFTFLFTLDSTPCFLLTGISAVETSQLTYENINFFRTTEQQETGWAAVAGFHIANWYTQHRFCGSCGTRTRHSDKERALVCPACNTVVYPTISPAIIVAITCGNKILLARNTNFKGGMYSLIAGYVDFGETIVETVRREVKEEIGIDITDIRYYKSQPWPLSGSLMLGFTAEADINMPITIDGKEIAEAAWFERGALPNHPPIVSIAGEMIDKFEKGEL